LTKHTSCLMCPGNRTATTLGRKRVVLHDIWPFSMLPAEQGRIRQTGGIIFQGRESFRPSCVRLGGRPNVRKNHPSWQSYLQVPAIPPAREMRWRALFVNSVTYTSAATRWPSIRPHDHICISTDFAVVIDTSPPSPGLPLRRWASVNTPPGPLVWQPSDNVCKCLCRCNTIASKQPLARIGLSIGPTQTTADSRSGSRQQVRQQGHYCGGECNRIGGRLRRCNDASV